MRGWWWFGKKKKTDCTAALAGKAKQLKLLDSFQFPRFRAIMSKMSKNAPPQETGN